jgi:hypothetical protein
MDVIERTKTDITTPASLAKKKRGGHAREMDRIIYELDKRKLSTRGAEMVRARPVCRCGGAAS